MSKGLRKLGRFRKYLMGGSLGFFLASVSSAHAGQVTVIATEVQAQRAGQILTISSQFQAVNHGDQPLLGVTVVGSDGSMVSIGDIPPRGETVSSPLVFAVDLGGFDGRNLAFPVTVQYYVGDSGQLASAQASFNCEIPDE